MLWQYTPYTLPLLFAALINIGLSFYAWKRRQAFGGYAFLALVVSLALWVVCEGMGHMRVDLAGKEFWGAMTYLWVVPVPALWLLIALQHTGRISSWRWRYMLLAVEPLLVLGLVFTQEYHMLWGVGELVRRDGYVQLNVHFMPLFWVHAAYSYALLLWGGIVLAREFFLVSGLYRQQVAALLFGVCVPWFANMARTFGWIEMPPSLVFSSTGLVFAWGIFRLQVMDLVPVASATLIERLQNGVVAVDAQDRLVFINPAAEQVLGGRPVVGEVLEHALPMLKEFTSDWGPRERVQTEWALGAGEAKRFYELQQSPLYGWQEMWTGRLFVLHDISARKNEEFELVQTTAAAESANHAKSEFLANMSHELRTPLNAILGYAQILRDSAELPADYGTSVQTMEHSADHLLRIIESILALARIEAGQQRLEVVDFALGELVSSLGASFAPRCEQKGLQWHVEELADGARVRADADKLYQVLVYLLDNALKFTAQGRVCLEVKQCADGMFCFAVSDTGPGIAPARQQAIFEPFQQEEIDFNEGGTGLGLTITQRYVELLGGTLALESQVGAGARFSFELALPAAAGGEGWTPQVQHVVEVAAESTVELDLGLLQIAPVLLRELGEAVKGHSITQLNHSLQVMVAEGGDAGRLAEYLRPLARHYDMAAIRRVLEELDTA